MYKTGNVTIMVNDVKSSAEFYTETLGLKLRSPLRPDWAEIEAPNAIIGLHGRGAHSPKSEGSGNMSFGLEVESLETAMATLKERGVQFSPRIAEDGPIRIAFFQDPDKTPLYIFETKKR